MDRVLLADDHPLFREALRGTINRIRPDLDVEEVDTLAEAQERLSASRYLLVLLDLKLPDCEGFLGLMTLRSAFPKTAVAIVSATEGAHVVNNAIAYGAVGYIPKSVRPAELAQALSAILEGDVWTPPNLDVESPSREAALIASLSPSQAKILVGMMRGQLNKQIAYDLGLTESTIRAHITGIFKKLGVGNRTQAALFIKNASIDLVE